MSEVDVDTMSKTTALSAETALSAKTALSAETATGHDVLSYEALINSTVFLLDCWRVYPTRNLIRQQGDNGEDRQLEPRLMRLLCLLAASADAVVGRDEIINVLWPRVVVNENSLTRAVSDLRRALTPTGDKRTSLIQTIPKRGYRLTRAPDAINTPERTIRQAADTGYATPSVQTASARHWAKRWTPSIAASFILALALVVRVSDDGQHGFLNSTEVAQLTQPVSIPTNPQPLYDRVIDGSGLTAVQRAHDAEALPTSLLRDSETPYPMTQPGSVPAWHTTVATGLTQNADPARSVGQSLLTPDGQLLAYVDYQDGISSLSLRPALIEAEPWVAFTTDERIYHLQWSPLDAGILLTVGQTSDSNERTSYLRLMLLDLETLTLQELYRRELPPEVWSDDIGSLT